MISIGIIGGSGYTGKYLIKFAEKHKKIKEYKIYAKSSAGKKINELFPDFDDEIENQTILSLNNISFEHDLYFIALPHGESYKIIPRLIERNKKVIDLGGDFRLDENELYKNWYGFVHEFPELLYNKIYGLADLNYPYVNKTNLIANPGCYPTSILLALYPLIRNFSDFIRNVSAVSYSGTSGAGRKANEELLLSEMYGNVRAYSINKHRHLPEILQELKKMGFKGEFAFTTHLLPVSRGIYSTLTVHLNSELDENQISSSYKNQYENSKFVRIRENAPELKWVVGTNFCDINVSVKNKVVIITSAIDNLIKGAAGQAIQNMNKIYGWEESTGLMS